MLSCRQITKYSGGTGGSGVGNGEPTNISHGLPNGGIGGSDNYQGGGAGNPGGTVNGGNGTGGLLIIYAN